MAQGKSFTITISGAAPAHPHGAHGHFVHPATREQAQRAIDGLLASCHVIMMATLAHPGCEENLLVPDADPATPPAD